MQSKYTQIKNPNNYRAGVLDSEAILFDKSLWCYTIIWESDAVCRCFGIELHAKINQLLSFFVKFLKLQTAAAAPLHFLIPPSK